MKRRDFIFQGILFGLGLNIAMKSALAAAINWVKLGTAGYKEVATPNQVQLNKLCHTCKWFTEDKKTAGAGVCKQMAVSKGKEVYVKKDGFCLMWSKRA